jgi:hypothetical protein
MPQAPISQEPSFTVTNNPPSALSGEFLKLLTPSQIQQLDTYLRVHHSNHKLPPFPSDDAKLQDHLEVSI